MENIGAACSSETIRRRPFLRRVSVNWILGTCEPARPRSATRQTARTRTAMEPPYPVQEVIDSLVNRAPDRRAKRGSEIYRKTRRPHGAVGFRQEAALTERRGLKKEKGRSIPTAPLDFRRLDQRSR